MLYSPPFSCLFEASVNIISPWFFMFVCLFVCLCRACIIIGGFLMLSGCAVLSKAVFMLIDDNERKRVRNYLDPARAIV